MPNRRFDWHEHIKEVESEYKAVRFAVGRLTTGPAAHAIRLDMDNWAREFLHEADKNLEGTYIVRLFAAFEAALRSYDRARHKNPARNEAASVLIDSAAGRRGQGISADVRAGAHAVRRVRNYWAHEEGAAPELMTIIEARQRLQKFLSWLPEEWA